MGTHLPGFLPPQHPNGLSDIPLKASGASATTASTSYSQNQGLKPSGALKALAAPGNRKAAALLSKLQENSKKAARTAGDISNKTIGFAAKNLTGEQKETIATGAGETVEQGAQKAADSLGAFALASPHPLVKAGAAAVAMALKAASGTLGNLAEGAVQSRLNPSPPSNTTPL